MKRPPEHGKNPEDVPPGGRAFERIQQDRIARGLGELPQPGAPSCAPPKPAAKRRYPKKRLNK